MTDLDKLDVETVTQLTHGSKDQFKETVKEENLSIKDLKALKEAESSGKGRQNILKFLDNQITSENVGKYLNIAEEDAKEIEDIIGKIEELEDLEHLNEEKIEIDQDQLIDLVGGTVSEMKDFIENNPLTTEQLEDVLSAEERIKDRKTAKRFLEDQIKKQKTGSSLENAVEDIKNLEKDLKEIDEVDQDRDVEDLDDVSSSVDAMASALEDEEAEENGNSEEAKDENSEDEDSKSEESEDQDDEKEEEEENSEGEEEKDEQENKDKSDLQKKRDIADELDLDMSEEELKEFSLDQLEEMEEEKRHRENLIERLKDQGMDEEELRNSSTSDLEKISESMDSQDDQEEHEEMREEAEEDLEMLMGAVRGDDEDGEEGSSKNPKEKLEDLKENIREKLNRSGDEDDDTSSGGINAANVQEVLDEYKELEDEEAAVKTAHIMKGYLEQKLGLEREMTYKELADKMPTEDDEEIEELSEFFVKMHKEQYTGRIQVSDSEAVIDTCQNVINKLG